MKKIAVYGKYGIGKSTTVSNLSAAISNIAILASMLVLAIGCGSDNNRTKEVNNTVGEVQKLKIASGTVAATQVMDKLEMELVGVSQISTELPKRYEGLT